ncbi:hypothetical protein ACA910_011715 [Epithemia clementina (nom. ined.)]
MSQYKIYLYNGNGGVVYGKSYTFAPENVTLGGPSSGLHFWVVQTPGLQNGPDGIALVAVGVTIRGDNEEDDDHDVVVEFLSYDGSFVAQDGPAKGHASMDVGVSETNSVPVVTTSQGSLQRVALGGGGGCRLGDNFPSRRWIRTHDTNTKGRVNVQQSFPCVATTAWINELHYKNKGSDRNEFVEVAFLVGPTPPDDWSFVLAGYQLILYNGHNGKTYRTYNFSTSSFSSSSNNNTTTTVTTDNNGLYFWVVDTPGIQNGSPDGVALVYNNSRVVEFLSYEGSFVATNGPAMGQTSRDIGVQESSTRTLANHSLQRIGKGCLGYDFATWSNNSNNSLNTKGRLNDGQEIDCGGSAPTSRPGSTSRRAFWWWSTPSPPSSDSIVKRDYGPFQLYIQCGSSYGYAVRFSYELKGPDRHDHPRASTYFEDEELPQNCQQKSFRSYSHSNCGSLSNRKKNPFCFDRGHLVAANHLDKSVHYMELSNVMTNILPQASGLNQAGGAWHRTEDIVECARDLPNVARQVIFGGAFFDDDSNDYFLQSHGIPTPDHFWKVVVRYYKGFFTHPKWRAGSCPIDIPPPTTSCTPNT